MTNTVELLEALKGLVSVADAEKWHDRFSLFASKNLAAARARLAIANAEGTVRHTNGTAPRAAKKSTLSAAGRKSIAAAQRKRWAEQKRKQRANSTSAK